MKHWWGRTSVVVKQTLKPLTLNFSRVQPHYAANIEAMNTVTKQLLGLVVFALCCLVTAQHRLDVENSLDFVVYEQAWQEATLDEVKAWVETGSGVNARAVIGSTPLMWAASINDNPEVTNVLIEAGAEVNARTENGKTPLMWAALHSDNPEVINALIKAGAEVNARTENGTTPLMLAARRTTNPEVVRVLLLAGADATLTDSYGDTAIDLAKGNEALKGTDAYWKLNDASF